MRYKSKTKQNRKNYEVHFHAGKNVICTGKKKDKKVNIRKSKHNYKILELTVFCFR